MKSTTKKRRTKTPRQRAIELADKWFSLYIRQRDRCSVTSGSTNNLTCSHLLSRRFFATRWDEENAYCQTAGENSYHNSDPGPLTAYYLQQYSADEYQSLYHRAHSGVKFTTGEIQEIARYWKMRYWDLVENSMFDVV